MRIRVVVADRSDAVFYDTDYSNSYLDLVGHMVDDKARLPDRAYNSDRPGRVFNYANVYGGRRGAVAHHSTNGENTPSNHEAELFARRIMDFLRSAYQQHAYDHILLISEPRFLGFLRQAMPEILKKIMISQLDKDLVHQGEQSIRSHISNSLFNSSFQSVDK